MPYCSQCGGEINETARFCRHCGNATDNSPVASPAPSSSPLTSPKSGSSSSRTFWKWVSIGGLSFFGLFFLMIIIGIIGESCSSESRPPRRIPTATPSAQDKPVDTIVRPTATPRPVNRHTPTPRRPTATPRPVRRSTPSFCSQENYARMSARYIAAIEQGNYSRASEINIDMARWVDQCLP